MAGDNGAAKGSAATPADGYRNRGNVITGADTSGRSLFANAIVSLTASTCAKRSSEAVRTGGCLCALAIAAPADGGTRA